MGTICSVICTSHSPYLYIPADEWSEARRLRDTPGAFADDVPPESDEENRKKHERCMSAFAVLGKQLREAKPDVLLIFGDDQVEQFSFANFPPFAVFVGEEFSGFKISPYYGIPLAGQQRPRREMNDENWTTVSGHPGLGRALLTGLMDRGFDPAFSHELPRKEEGLGHAFMRPTYSMRGEFDLPTVPIFINCYYGPQPSGIRCYQLGRAVAEIVADMPDHLRVAVIGSGGLWHTPLYPNSTIDRDFDRSILNAVESGEAKEMARYFDTYPPYDNGGDEWSQEFASGGTGIVTGLSSGTGETRNWIAASAVVEGRPGTVVDYVPIHASPIGVAFAYWQCE